MLNKNNFIAILVLTFLSITIANAQLLCPFNMGFESGYEESPVYGWGVGIVARDSGYKAVTTEKYYSQGLASAKIYTNNEKKIPQTASFYQRIEADFYRNKTIKFTADVMVETLLEEMLSGDQTTPHYMYSFSEPCYLFISARDKIGNAIIRSASEKIVFRGWNLGISVELTIPEDAVDINYGISFTDTSTLYLDNCKLEIISNDSTHYTASSPLSNVEKLFLTAFTNVAGVVQYFHPSKNSLEANWEDVYFAGVNRAKTLTKELEKIKNNDTLLNLVTGAVQEFFVPYCPEIKIDYASNRGAVEPQLLKTDKTFDTNKYLLAYIHQGIPIHKKMYSSAKNQTSTVINLNAPIKNFPARLMQYVTVLSGFEPNKHNKAHLSAFVNLKNPDGYYKNIVKMYIRFEDQMGDFVGFSEVKEMSMGGISTNNDTGWIKFEMDVDIIEETTKFLIVFELQGYGATFIDDVECFTYNDREKDNKTKMILKNPGFELSLGFDVNNWLTTNETFDAGYQISYSDVVKRTGKQSLVIFTLDNPPYFVSRDSSIINFDALVMPSGTINCTIPMYVEATTTESIIDTIRTIVYQTTPYHIAPKLNTNKNANFSMNWQDRDSRLVSAMLLHNSINHFVEKADIQHSATLEEFAICNSIEKYMELLHNIIGKEKRNRVWNSTSADVLYSLPFQVEIYNDSLYISDILDTTNFLHKGMKITKIKNKNWKEYLGINSNTITDTETKFLLREKFILGKLNEQINFDVEVDGNNLPMISSYNTLASYFSSNSIKGWNIFEDSIIYIDLSNYSDKEIYVAFDSLKDIKHWILDIRGDVMVSDYFVSLYADSIFRSSGTIVPINTAPFKTLIQGEPNFDVIPKSETKQIEGKVVFLINENTYSYGELLAATIKQQGKGILIGQPTQGAVISANGFRLDTDIFVSIGKEYGFTPSGYPIFDNPILPDIYINYNPNNPNNDYILDAAIEYVKKK